MERENALRWSVCGVVGGVQQVVPFSALGSLFDFHNSSNADAAKQIENDLNDIQDELEETYGIDASILRAILPALQQELPSPQQQQHGNSSTNGLTIESHNENPVVEKSTSDNDYTSTISTIQNNHVAEHLQNNQVKMPLFQFLFRLVFQKLCRATRPLLIFLDDLQWADQQSLEVLHYLTTIVDVDATTVTDSPKGMVDEEEMAILSEQTSSSKASSSSSINYFFFIGGFRSNEVDSDHKLWDIIPNNRPKGESSGDNWQTQDQMITPNVIELGGLSKPDIGEFMADTLRLDVDEVEPILDVVFTKTLGNVYFTMQAMEQLVRKNVLYYDVMSFCWSWVLRHEEPFAELLSDDIVEMVKSKIIHMPKGMQRVLITASYTRDTFDVDTLEQLLHNPQPQQPTAQADQAAQTTDLVSTLEQAVEEGLLSHVGTQRTSSSPQRTSNRHHDEYSFTHDKVKEAAQSLVSVVDEGRETFLVRTGKTLATRASSEHGEEWMYFAATQLLNMVIDPGGFDSSERLGLAELNLYTAKRSKALLSLSSALNFVEVGVRYLPEDMWATAYDLALELYTLGAEAQMGLGNLDKAQYYCNVVLRQKRKDIHDVIPIYKVLVEVLALKSEGREAYKLTLDILTQLGLKFPANAKLQKIMAWASLKQTKSRYILEEESIQQMPYISDPKVINLMDILDKGASMAYENKDMTMYALLRCKWIKLMNKHGLTDNAGGAVASLGNIVMNVLGDFDAGPKLAEAGLMSQDRIVSKSSETHALNTAGFNVLSWVRPMRSCLKYYSRAYDSGMVSGNIDGALIGKWYSHWTQLYSAMPLPSLLADCQNQMPFLQKIGFKFHNTVFRLVWQSVLNLMAKSKNTTILTGEAMNETDEIYQKTPFKQLASSYRSFLYAIFGDFDLGAKDALQRGDEFPKAFVGLLSGLEPFYRGVSLYAMATRTGVTAYSVAAVKILKQLRDWLKKGCVNLEGCVQLLAAEDAVLSGKDVKVCTTLFDDAISISVRDEFYNHAALGCERYAEYLQRQVGDTNAADSQLFQAIDYYSRWGASRKVEMLHKRLRRSTIYGESLSSKLLSHIDESRTVLLDP